MVHEKKPLSEKLLISKLMHNNKNREPWKRQLPRTDSALVAFSPFFRSSPPSSSSLSLLLSFSFHFPLILFLSSGDRVCAVVSPARMWGKNVGEI